MPRALTAATNPVFSGTITGIQNGDNITATYATTATVTSPVGTYPITPTLVDPNGKLANYTVTMTNGTLTVTAAALTVTANNASRTYGATNPVFSGTITGIQNGDNITATYATTATISQPSGNVSDHADPGGPEHKLTNYAVTMNNGTLTVTPAPPPTILSISASRQHQRGHHLDLHQQQRVSGAIQSQSGQHQLDQPGSRRDGHCQHRLVHRPSERAHLSAFTESCCCQP